MRNVRVLSLYLYKDQTISLSIFFSFATTNIDCYLFKHACALLPCGIVVTLLSFFMKLFNTKGPRILTLFNKTFGSKERTDLTNNRYLNPSFAITDLQTLPYSEAKV